MNKYRCGSSLCGAEWQSSSECKCCPVCRDGRVVGGDREKLIDEYNAAVLKARNVAQVLARTSSNAGLRVSWDDRRDSLDALTVEMEF